MAQDSIQQAKEALRQELVELQDRLGKVREALKSLDNLGNGQGQATAAIPLTSLRTMPMIKAAAVVLKEAGEPLHVNQIMERMMAGGWRPTSPKSFRTSLVGSLDRGSKPETPGWFLKPSPATYGLRDWELDGR